MRKRGFSSTQIYYTYLCTYTDLTDSLMKRVTRYLFRRSVYELVKNSSRIKQFMLFPVVVSVLIPLSSWKACTTSVIQNQNIFIKENRECYRRTARFITNLVETFRMFSLHKRTIDIFFRFQVHLYIHFQTLFLYKRYSVIRRNRHSISPYFILFPRARAEQNFSFSLFFVFFFFLRSVPSLIFLCSFLGAGTSVKIFPSEFYSRINKMQNSRRRKRVNAIMRIAVVS